MLGECSSSVGWAEQGLRSLKALILILALFTAVPNSDLTAQTFTDPQFSAETVATFPPFTLVGVVWAPDGRMFVWQKNGIVKIIKNGAVLSTPFIDLSAVVNTFDDRGMWGLALHPDFGTTGHVYMTYVREDGGNPNDSSAKASRLVRVTTDPDNPDRALPGSEVIILGDTSTPIPIEEGSHAIGNIRFAPDGKLFVASGDGAGAWFADPLSMAAQDLNSLNGKILRINDDGTAPGDNPFDDGTNSIRSRVWALGVRNPYSLHLHPVTGEPYFGEVGWHTWEEVNRGVRGGNFGWPCYEGINPSPPYQSAFPQCAQVTNVIPPMYTYHHNEGSAAIGGPFYMGDVYPEVYRGNYFFADYASNWIRRVTFDAAGNPSAFQMFATEVDSPTTLAVGPDDMLYYLSFATGAIRRIRYNGPTAVASATPQSGYSPLTVSFSSAGSTSPNGNPLTFSWDFGDGGTSTQANPTHTYVSATPRTLTATLTASTTTNQTSVATVEITVGSTPPAVTILTPAEGTGFQPGQVITYRGEASDADETLSASALKWTILLHHNSHIHTSLEATGLEGSFTAEFHGTGTYAYELRLTATDSTGLTGSDGVLLPVLTDMTPPTVPANLRTGVVGNNHAILMWDPSTDGGQIAGYRIERCTGAACTVFTQVASATVSPYTAAGLTPQTTYRFRVRAEDGSGNLSGYSNIVAATTTVAPPDSTPPAMPPGLTTSGITDVRINLSWGAATDNVGVTGYRVERCSGAGCAGFVEVAATALLTYSNLGLTPGTIYRYRVRAVDAAGNSGAYSNIATAATLSDATAPAAPTVLTATGVNSNQINLTWNAATDNIGVTGYRLERCQGSSCTNFVQIATPGTNSYSDAGLTVKVTYRYRVRAVDGAGNVGPYSSSASATTPDTTPPTAPSDLTAVPASPVRIDLSWGGATDNVAVMRYRVERCLGAGCTGFVQIATPTGRTYASTGLAASTTYRYRVRAADSAGNLGEYSSVVDATTMDGIKPSNPTGLTASPVSSNQINLSWNASTDNIGVTGYRLQRCQGTGCSTFADIATPTGTTHADMSLAAGTTYRHRVRAVDAAGNLSGFSNIVTSTTPAVSDPTPPTAPPSVTAIAVSSGQINLSWGAASDNIGVTNYLVERCAGVGCTNFVQTAVSAGTTYNDTGLLASTTYAYRVRATDLAGNLGPYSPVTSGTTLVDATPPTAPSSLNATAISGGQINLGWTAATDNSGVAGYGLERCAGAGCSNFVQVATPSGTSYSDIGLSPGTTYSYRVRATDLVGNAGPYSPVASATTVSDATPPAAPSSLMATVVSNTQINLNWVAATDNVGVTGYLVERCTGAGCSSFVQLATPTGTSHNDLGLLSGTTYRYRVRATDAAGNLGAYSNIVAPTTPGAPAPTGLVAAYGFDEGVGVTITDVSGNGNAGTIAGATWTPSGKFGTALEFNGVDSLVSIPASASLNVSAAMTLEAWIYPIANQSGWRTVIQREVNAYMLNASTSEGPLVPGGGGTFGGVYETAAAPPPVPVGAWTHLAVTYNGAMVTMYVNGALVESNAISGSIETNTNPLWIGGNVPFGEFFQGRIDEIRVYNRALSQAEIQTDMNTPVTP